jgi:hypothetical protein
MGLRPVVTSTSPHRPTTRLAPSTGPAVLRSGEPSLPPPRKIALGDHSDYIILASEHWQAAMRLRDWIDSMGVSGAARALGVSRTCVYHWKNGARTPSQKLRTRIRRVSKGRVVFGRVVDPCPLRKRYPYHVIRIPVNWPRGLRESDLRRACIEIDRGKWPIEYYPDRD